MDNKFKLNHKIVILVVAILLGVSSGYVFKKEDGSKNDDNILEETAEDIIKSNLGIDIDLTPDSKE